MYRLGDEVKMAGLLVGFEWERVENSKDFNLRQEEIDT